MRAEPRRMVIEPDEEIVTGTPGLVVHRHSVSVWAPVETRPLWFVVHEGSGRRLAGFMRPSGLPVVLMFEAELDALTAAGRLAGLCDWTLGQDELQELCEATDGELLFAVGAVMMEVPDGA